MPEGFFGHFLNEDYYEVAAVEAAGYYKFANRDQNEASLRCLQEAELIIAASETASCDSGRDSLEAARVQSRQRLSSAREIYACNPGRFLSVATALLLDKRRASKSNLNRLAIRRCHAG